MQVMARKRIPTQFTLDPEVIARLDAWVAKQVLHTASSRVVELAITQFLDRQEPDKVPAKSRSTK